VAKTETESDEARKERIIYVCAQRIRNRSLGSSFSAWACTVAEQVDQKERMRTLCLRIVQRKIWGCFETWCVTPHAATKRSIVHDRGRSSDTSWHVSYMPI
jgi:hypothetical protein